MRDVTTTTEAAAPSTLVSLDQDSRTAFETLEGVSGSYEQYVRLSGLTLLQPDEAEVDAPQCAPLGLTLWA